MTEECAALKSSSEQGCLVPILSPLHLLMVPILLYMFVSETLCRGTGCVMGHKACDVPCFTHLKTAAFGAKKNLTVSFNVTDVVVYNYRDLLEEHLFPLWGGGGI